MTQGYYAAISGMQTNQYGLDVISDNLTNVSTTAYKSSTAEFADLFSKAVSGNTPTYNDIGYGVKLQATSFNLTQGSMMSSDRFNDLALEGNGWFGVTSKGQTMFTRDGSFSFDTYQKTSGDVNSSINRLVTADGQFVLGTMLSNFTYSPTYDYGDLTTTGSTGAYVLNNPTTDAPLSAAGSQGTLEFPSRLAYPVQPTTKTTFVGNLGITDATRTISAQVISGNNDINQLKLTFTKSAVQPATGVAWDVVATVTSTDGKTVYDTQNGQAVFGASGSLDSFNIASVNNNGTPVAVDLGAEFSGVIAVDGVGISGSSTSDGISAGSLTKYGINADGVIIADFSNGRQSAIGRVAVYHFQNDQGLNREGGTYYTQTSDSGKPLFWTDTNGNAITGATVRSNSLESSNSDMSVGLTDMIVSQRAYQANSKIVTTVDEMIQKALQMHR
ncbi:flagellar hook-basal body complex protein [Sulfuricurvum sp.]|uniref:flagellar hook-basal body complex protein n=1 Tax=Sulfuricurvum sp. TaxID=2025608 RepID=UPI00260AB739|nr:flagellar hook-basal body complex protein [Sulfuricurvum sp.]MDD2265787.1 flagellar hook-basal body complex protein [Sulfuricurvum sp.]MDD2783114.1 flagellar hook-basal body complex protein [Sulfuricurvum sp.]